MAVATPHIALVNIECELKRLWDEQQGQKRTRACLFNLIVFAKKNNRDAYCHSLIEKVLSKFPCRILSITEDETAEESLTTEVSAVAVGKESFCEVIHLSASHTMLERIPSLLLPHIVPDLPVYLFWTEDPTCETTIMPQLEPLATRIIFDATTATDLQTFCHSLTEIMARTSSEVSDPIWSCLKGWRKLFATTFDTGETLRTLMQCKIMRIVYYNSNHSSRRSDIAAAYFQGWIAAQLDWQFHSIEKSEGHVRLTYKRPAHDITVILTPYDDPLEPLSLPPGAFLEVEIESMSKTSWHFKRDEKAARVFVQHSDENRCDLPYVSALSKTLAGEGIMDEIFYPSSREHYRTTLMLLAQIPWEKS